MPPLPVHYQSPDEDSARWLDFPYRPGDIVISTRSKHGTTWMQMICALLIFRTLELPAPLAELSPWLDWLVLPHQEILDRLAAQQHRRFIKTHTPLDGLPLDPHVTYLVVARHPLDAAVSMYHQGNNLDRERLRELTGSAEPASQVAARPPLGEWLLAWIDRDVDPRDELDSLPGVLHHLTDAWPRGSERNVVLVHYDDLSADLEGQMRQLADRLGLAVPEPLWPELAAAATFPAMRAHARQLAPDPTGVLRDQTAFFRSGTSGAAQQLLSSDEVSGYYARARQLAPDDLLSWLHRQRDHGST